MAACPSSERVRRWWEPSRGRRAVPRILAWLPPVSPHTAQPVVGRRPGCRLFDLMGFLGEMGMRRT
jgi:hypothetical protein